MPKAKKSVHPSLPTTRLPLKALEQYAADFAHLQRTIQQLPPEQRTEIPVPQALLESLDDYVQFRAKLAPTLERFSRRIPQIPMPEVCARLQVPRPLVEHMRQSQQPRLDDPMPLAVRQCYRERRQQYQQALLDPRIPLEARQRYWRRQEPSLKVYERYQRQGTARIDRALAREAGAIAPAWASSLEKLVTLCLEMLREAKRPPGRRSTRVSDERREALNSLEMAYPGVEPIDIEDKLKRVNEKLMKLHRSPIEPTMWKRIKGQRD